MLLIKSSKDLCPVDDIMLNEIWETNLCEQLNQALERTVIMSMLEYQHSACIHLTSGTDHTGKQCLAELTLCWQRGL